MSLQVKTGQQLDYFDKLEVKQPPEAIENKKVLEAVLVGLHVIRDAKAFMLARGGKPASYAEYEMFKRRLGYCSCYDDLMDELITILKV